MKGVLLALGGPLADSTAAALQGNGVGVRMMPLSRILQGVEEPAPDAVVVELTVESAPFFGELRQIVPEPARILAVARRFEKVEPEVAVADTLLLGRIDASTVVASLGEARPLDARAVATVLADLTVLGPDPGAVLANLQTGLARGFDADECVIRFDGEEVPFSDDPDVAERIAVLAELAEDSSEVQGTVMVGPSRFHPYRAFVGARLTVPGAPSMGTLLLCRAEPVRFSAEALALFRAVAARLAVDLSWRRAHERLAQDRERLRELSRIDPALGVWNRTTLEQEVPNRIMVSQRRGEAVSVAIVDIDALRHINQRHGYPAGDAVLLHVAQVARREVRAQDVVARYAGDSLALLLPGASAKQAEMVLERVLRDIDRTPVKWEGDDLPVTISCGVAELLGDDDSANAAFGRAVAARRDARQSGQVIGIADASTRAVTVQADLETDATLGGVYQIRHEISRGAFGVVYRAEDLALGRHVALKLLRPDLARDSAIVERFRVEAATLARIRHENLVQVYAFGIEGQSVYFAMELIEGHGLDHRIHEASRRHSFLALAETMRIIQEVAGALEAVHRAGMVHRDVKPENILIDRVHRRAVLVDAGIAVRRGEKDPAGTPGFTAPEVFGNGREGPWTDVYGLGAVAYSLLTGETPFGRGQPNRIIDLQKRSRPRFIVERRADLPEEIDDVLLPALDPDPQKRPQTVSALAEALLDILQKHRQAQTQQTQLGRRSGTGPPGGRAVTNEPAPKVPARTTPSPSTVTVPPPAEGPWTMRNPSGGLAEPFTRGVLFRACYPVLGARRGAAWLRSVAHEEPNLMAALGPGSSPLAWHPTPLFVALLRTLGNLDLDALQVATLIGREAVSSSFNLFYAADASAVSPADVLRASDLLWACYHSWGTVSISASERLAEVELSGLVSEPLLCAVTTGILAEITSQAGGVNEDVSHPRCAARGQGECSFVVKWDLSA